VTPGFGYGAIILYGRFPDHSPTHCQSHVEVPGGSNLRRGRVAGSLQGEDQTFSTPGDGEHREAGIGWVGEVDQGIARDMAEVVVGIQANAGWLEVD